MNPVYTQESQRDLDARGAGSNEGGLGRFAVATVHFDSLMGVTSAARNALGDLFVFSPRSSLTRLVEFAREMIEEVFAPHSPQSAQNDMPVERFVEVFGLVKPRFIRHRMSTPTRPAPRCVTSFGAPARRPSTRTSSLHTTSAPWATVSKSSNREL